jgi:hypothetical protein
MRAEAMLRVELELRILQIDDPVSAKRCQSDTPRETSGSPIMLDRLHPSVRKRARLMARVLVLAASTWLCGCASQSVTPQARLPETARFYWPYAALASQVYQPADRLDNDRLLAAASPWIRSEVEQARDPALTATLARMLEGDLVTLYRRHIEARCPTAGAHGMPASEDDALRAAENRCLTAAEVDAAARLRRQERDAEDNRFSAAVPTRASDCEASDGQDPAVPVDVAARQYGWEPVRELQRHTHPRGWSLFVPGLAIDVWRRRLSPQGDAPSVEYAIVYRGTVGGGGWMSNFRALSAFTPLVWDQYHQAKVATDAIVNQVYRIHALSDALFKRPSATRIHFTAVGHSLGAGLAHYILLRVKQVTRVVGFDPSPVNGSALIPLDERPAVLAQRPQAIDGYSQAAIFMLFEKGEVISRFAPCQSGPVWGSEGGPVVRCESVDFSRGSMFRQHNMARLACKLFLAVGGDGMEAAARSHESTMADR